MTTRRKKPRTAAQKRATRKLIALNKARMKKPSRRKVAKKNPRRKTSSRRSSRWVIRALGKGAKNYYWTGEKLAPSKAKAYEFPSRDAAKKKAVWMVDKLPRGIAALEVRGA